MEKGERQVQLNTLNPIRHPPEYHLLAAILILTCIIIIIATGTEFAYPTKSVDDDWQFLRAVIRCSHERESERLWDEQHVPEGSSRR
jgi:hypothetical protein